MYVIWPIFVLLYKVFWKIIVRDRTSYVNLSRKHAHIKIMYIIFLAIAGIIVAIMFPFAEYIENSIQIYWYLPVFIVGMILALIYSLTPMFKRSIIFDFFIPTGVIGILIFTPLMRQLLWKETPSSWLQNKYLLMSIW